MFTAAAGGSQIGSNATTTFVSSTNLKAVFGGSGVPVAGNVVYVEVDNTGITNRFATAITVNAFQPENPLDSLSSSAPLSFAQGSTG